MVLFGPVLMAAATLIVSGFAKLTQPDSAVGAFSALALGGGRITARFVGIVEVALAVAVVAAGGSAYLILGVWYVVLAVAAWWLVREGSASCGCFGAESAPPTALHVGANAVAVLVALGAAATGVRSAPVELADLGWALSVQLLLWVVIGTVLIVAVYRLLPLVLAGGPGPLRRVGGVAP